MPTIGIHSNLQLLYGQDITKANCDVLVVPQSKNGHINNAFLSMTEQLGFYPEKDTAPGHLDTRGTLDDTAPFKYLVFAVTEGENGTSYNIVRDIGVNLGLFAQRTPDVISIACTVIGAGSGELNGFECVKILAKAFAENSDKALTIYTNDQATFDAIEQLNNHEFGVHEFNNTSSRKSAFNASVKKSHNHQFIAPIINSAEFYYALAKAKFEEYLNYESDAEDFFQSLKEDFKSQWASGFIETLGKFTDSQKEYEFLKICGELVAYIDVNAAGKSEWNHYNDKRVIARSRVNQFDWINNLIHYRIRNDILGVASSVINAIRFLSEPATNLCMLSNRHRKMLLENIYSTEYLKQEDLDIVFKQFELWGLRSSNPVNTGALITRILYLDEIEKLWNFNPDEKYGDLFPGDLEEAEYQPVPAEKKTAKTIESTFLTDYYAEADLLDYELYAAAIVAFINHKNTKPPLTIGIMAPWGKGKTSLMRFIERRLKAIPSLPPAKTPKEDKQQNKTATFSLFSRWLDKAKEKFTYEGTLQYPTVWFNAWKFQKTEQIWAGFAYEIIHQLVNQLPDQLAKEEFWLRLNLKRIDQEKLRNKITFKVLNKTIAAVSASLLALSGVIISIFSHWPVWVDLLTEGILPLGAIFYLVKKHEKVSNERIDFDIEKFVKQPDYATKRGYFHEVEDDLRDVMNLLVAEAKPAVIFIDDLDRCSPNTVAEVVEAINLFISGDFPKCYFILGQDAQMVAASLDVAYDKFSNKSADIFREQGSIGWHFMEKFIQMQFCIPVLNDEQAQAFFRNFFNQNSTEINTEKKQVADQKAMELEAKLDAGEKVSDILTPEVIELERELKIINPEKAISIQEKLIEKAAAQYDDNDPEVLQLIKAVSTCIGTSPRSIKRFINLYRFYKFLQLTNRNAKLQETSSDRLGQWIVIMIRWPQLARAIQWHTDGEFIKGATALERAEFLEQNLQRYATYNEWANLVQSEAPQLAWLKDMELYSFLKNLRNNQNSLKDAVNMGIW